MPENFIELAITGMDVSFAGCDGLDAFECVIYEAGQAQARADAGRAAIPITSGSALLDKVAQRAMRDSGFEAPGARVIIFAAGAGPGWQPPGDAARVVDLSTQPNPLAAAIEQSQRAFAAGEADAALFAAASDLPELPADVPVSAAQALGFDREVHGWRFGEGACAAVWMPARQAETRGLRVYATLRGFAAAAGNGGAVSDLPVPPVLDDLRVVIRAALEQAGVSPEQIGYVEAFAGGVDALDGIEIAGLAQTYRQPVQSLVTALGSAQANAGYLGSAAGLLGLIRAALCVYHRIIPAAPGWSAPKLPALWRGAPFYVPVESRTWFSPATGPGRLAAVNIIGLGGSAAHLVLAEAAREALHPNRSLECSGFYLIPLVGDTQPEIIDQLEDLQQVVMFAPSLAALAAEWHAAAQARPGARYAVALLGHNHDELLREIELALKSIPAVFEKSAAGQTGAEWQTPLGSCFAADPIGQQGDVALVYPGAFNSYPGVGKDLFRLFPWLHLKSVGRTLDLGRVIRERLLYPRSLAAPGKDELAQHEADLLSDPVAMLTSGTTIAILFTYILEEAFKIRPAAAFGYSLGENSMLFASGIWQEGDAVTDALESTPLFRSRLAGPQNAIREYWGLPPRESPSEEPLWANYLVMAPVERVYQALQSEPRVYVTHVNTPRQVVIAGDPAACQRVIAALRCSSLQAPFDYALHCEAMVSEFDELARLHNWPIERQPHVRMYSAADYGPVALERNEVARRVARMLTSSLDFPRLVRRVYEDGARVFIEAGAGSNCARWIDETLKGEPHLAVSINRRGTDDLTSLLRTLARLYSHRVPLDLSPLYESAIEKVSL